MNRSLLYNRTYQTIQRTSPPAHVIWETSSADIISPGRGFMRAFDYTMQWLVGCPGGCLFCYLIASRRVVPQTVRGEQGETWGFVVREKTAIIPQLTKYLQQGRLTDKTIYWSGVTDPYAAAPALTRIGWETLLQTPQALRPRRLVVQTRFRPDRDAALMQQYSTSTMTSDGGPPLLISYSVGTDRNDLIADWERATPLFEQRMHAIQTLCEAGLWVVVTVSPLGLWRDLPGALAQFKAWGVAYLTCLFFKEHTPSANTPRHFLAYLREHYPLLLDPDWQTQQVQTMQAIYGSARVLVGKAGFDSLAQPHWVAANGE